MRWHSSTFTKYGRPKMCLKSFKELWNWKMAFPTDFIHHKKTRAVLSPGNRAKPCKFRYVKSVRSFMWKLCYRKDDHAMRPMPWKLWGLPDYAHGYYSQNFSSMAFVPIDPMNVPTKFEVHSFTRSWDNRTYPKNLGSPWICHAPFSPKFLMGFYSDWPCTCTRQIWSQ